MEDCQNERGKYCPNCGQKAELDGQQYHELFCSTPLAARMPALLKAAEEAAQQSYPSDKFREDIATIRAINAREAQRLYNYWQGVNWIGFDMVKPSNTDPDGALTPLPTKPTPARTVAAPSHDFIGALYKPYFSPI